VISLENCLPVYEEAVFLCFVSRKYRREEVFLFSYTENIEEREKLLFRILKISKREKNSFFVYPKYRREKKALISYTGQYTKSKEILLFDIPGIRNPKKSSSSIFQVYEIR